MKIKNLIFLSLLSLASLQTALHALNVVISNGETVVIPANVQPKQASVMRWANEGADAENKAARAQALLKAEYANNAQRNLLQGLAAAGAGTSDGSTSVPTKTVPVPPATPSAPITAPQATANDLANDVFDKLAEVMNANDTGKWAVIKAYEKFYTPISDAYAELAARAGASHRSVTLGRLGKDKVKKSTPKKDLKTKKHSARHSA